MFCYVANYIGMKLLTILFIINYSTINSPCRLLYEYDLIPFQLNVSIYILCSLLSQSVSNLLVLSSCSKCQELLKEKLIQPHRANNSIPDLWLQGFTTHSLQESCKPVFHSKEKFEVIQCFTFNGVAIQDCPHLIQAAISLILH